MSNPYKTREGGATVTVFVPYDCGNHCPFCINKKEYENLEGFSVDRICDSIEIMNDITPYCDFVFTGGEPFADLESLQIMLDKLPSTHKVYINTTLPILPNHTADDLVDFIARNKNKITGVNVSRHHVKYVQECSDDIFPRIAVPVRINCVLYRNYPKQDLIKHIERFRKYNIPIQFRFDYTDTKPDNLYDEENDMIFKHLNSICSYTGLDGCRMRCGYYFDYYGLPLTYHKTLPYSTIKENDGRQTFDILYDIIIKQNGDLHSDWDGTLLNIEAYKQVCFEKYDLRKIV